MSLSGGNLAFERTQGTPGIDYDSYIIFNGENIGKGFGPVVSGDNLAYYKVISGSPWSGGSVYHVIFNGDDLGEANRFGIQISGKNIAFQREVNGKKHVIFNGQDLGEGEGIVVS